MEITTISLLLYMFKIIPSPKQPYVQYDVLQEGCKFSEWCRFSHDVVKDASENDSEVKKLEEKLNTVEIELKQNSEKVLKLESQIKEMHLKLTEKDQNVSKINKKYNVLKKK